MATAAPVRPLSSIIHATVHHSAAYPGAKDRFELSARVKAYDKLHGSKSYALTTKAEFGLPHISYHFAIAKDGSIIQLQDIKYVRNHCTDSWRGTSFTTGDSSNWRGIAILLDGHFDKESPTPQQLNSCAGLIKKLNAELGKKLIIEGHRERSGPKFLTSCPGATMGLSTDFRGGLKTIINKVYNQSPMILLITGVIALIASFFFIKPPNPDEIGPIEPEPNPNEPPNDVDNDPQ